MIVTVAGGIGLFLLGMVLLTDGLTTAAGAALRGVLGRFTGGMTRAVLSGAGLTALVQSSHATVLTTIGFVSAGLLTLRQAIGVIFGANIGTTSTGWIVSLLGLRLSIGAAALPLVGIGALMRLLARDRLAGAGLAVAGLGLIFFGIDVLQDGMASLSERIAPDSLPPATLSGRVLLVVIGILMTVVMQSSSAAVATTLTALHSGAISLEQAAALVVGQNVGTTVTAALAAVGASVPARRTAVAHIMFNLLTGVVAFFLVPTAVLLESAAAAYIGGAEPAVLIAAFHTAFNVAGVLLLVPFIGPFTRLVQRIVPERGTSITRHLDPSVAEMPQVAVEAARRAIMEAGDVVVATLHRALLAPRRDTLRPADLDTADEALRETRRFLGRVPTGDRDVEHARHLSAHHAIDHLGRLIDRLRFHTPADDTDDEAFDRLRNEAAEMTARLRPWLQSGTGEPYVADWQEFSTRVASRRRADRALTLQRTATGLLDPDVANANLEAMRWLDSSAYHLWRALHHLAEPDPVAATSASAD
jgi:phosphate:Na+ symporter